VTTTMTIRTIKNGKVEAHSVCNPRIQCNAEFFARLLALFWCWQRQIQTTFENVYVRFVLAHTAH